MGSCNGELSYNGEGRGIVIVVAGTGLLQSTAKTRLLSACRQSGFTKGRLLKNSSVQWLMLSLFLITNPLLQRLLVAWRG